MFIYNKIIIITTVLMVMVMISNPFKATKRVKAFVHNNNFNMN